MVARTRSTNVISHKSGIEKTFFDQFGLEVPHKFGVHQISIKVVTDSTIPGNRKAVVLLNGEFCATSMLANANCPSVMVVHSIGVSTADSLFLFHARRLDSERSHFNVHVRLIGDASTLGIQ